MRIARSVIGLVFAAALIAPASADEPLGPTPKAADYVVVSTARTMAMANTPRYTLRFNKDGTAVYDGPIEGLDGHYVADVDFAPVQAAITKADLCGRPGIGLFIEPPMSNKLLAPAMRTKLPRSVLVRLSCEKRTATFNEHVADDLPAFADTLLGLAIGLSWKYTGPAQRESITRFAQ